MSLVNKVKDRRVTARPQPHDSGPPGELGRLRAALCAVFAIHGFIFASWAIRIPAIKAQTGTSPAALGLALLGLSAGAVATMLLAGTLCRRFGNVRMTVVSAGLLSATLVLPALAGSALALGLLLAVFGAAYGCLNVAMNSVAVDLVAALRRPVMPGFHAAWSFGGLAGAALGGLLAMHLSPLRHLLLIALAGLAASAVAGLALLTGEAALRDALAEAVPAPTDTARTDTVRAGPARADTARAGPARADTVRTGPARAGTVRTDPARAGTGPAGTGTDGRRGAAWREALRTVRIVGLFGLIALCAAYDEGAIGDWSALHLRQDLGAGAALAAAGYAAFALAEASGRLAGTALLERFGRTRVLILGGLTACAGMLLASLAPVAWLALAGFAATGLGLANLFPAAIARAGLLAGAGGVALTSTLGYSGFLLGPVAIGFLASQFGLGAGLTTLAFLGLAAAAIAHMCRDQPSVS